MNPRIILLALGTFALGTDAFVVAGVLPKVGSDLGVGVDVAGWIVATFSLTYGLGAPFLAALTGNLPRHILLLLALAVFTVANILSALAPTFELLLLTRILAGASAALYSPTAYTLATVLAPPHKRGQALATVIAGLTISTVLGVPLGTWIGQSLNWRMTFGLVALLGGLAVVILWLIGLPRVETPSLGLWDRLAPIVRPRVLLGLLPTLVWSVGVFAVYTFITPLLQQITHVQDTGLLLLVYGLGAMIGSWFGGYAVDRFGAGRPLLGGLVLLIISLAVLPQVAGTVIGAAVGLFVWALAGWSLFPPQQHRLLGLFPESSNVILALNNSALYLGTAGGATIGGLVLKNMGVTNLGWIGALFALLALGILLVGPRPTTATRPQTEGVVLEMH